MIQASVSYTKNNLSALLAQVKDGETVIVTDRDKPVARIVATEELSGDARIADLTQRGILNPPKRRLVVSEIVALKPEYGEASSLLSAVLEERNEGY